MLDYGPQTARRVLCVNRLPRLPFLPLNMVFCKVVETSNLDDSNARKALVQTMELFTENPDHTRMHQTATGLQGSAQQAAKYVEGRGYGPSSVRWRDDVPDAAKRPDGIVTAGSTVASSHVQPSGAYVDSGLGSAVFCSRCRAQR